MSGIPRSRRSKEDRPCDVCRKKKSRCVFRNGEDTCLCCQSYNLPCTFVEVPKPRKKKAPRSSVITDAIARDELSPAASSSQRTPEGLGRNDSADIYIISDNGFAGNGNSNLDWEILGLQHRYHSRYIGATCGIRPSVLNSTNGTHEAMLANGSMRKVSTTDMFMMIPDSATPGYDAEASDLEAIQAIVSPHGTSLIDLYFRVIHGSYPILYKPFYLDASGRGYHNFSPALLATIYLLALRYWSYDIELSEFPKPDVLALEQLARKTVLNDFHKPKLSSIAAGLFLLQYSDIGSAELTAQLISVGFGLGIHADATNWCLQPWEIGLRKRLAWALYMQDTWSALGSGRPRLISTTNWNVQPLVHDDFSEDFKHENEQEGSSEVEKGKLLFSYMVSLTEILADVLVSLYTMQADKELSAAGDLGLELVLEKAKPLQIRLKEWYVNLPRSLNMDNIQAVKLSSAGSLRLDYLATEATIHRRILTAASQCPCDAGLSEILQQAASTRFLSAIDFVQALKPQELMSFWYTASKTNLALIGTFGIILCATARRAKDRSFFVEKLKAYRWALKVNHMAGAQFMKPALSLLEADMKTLDMTQLPSVQQDDEIEDVEQDDAVAYRSTSYPAVEEWMMSPGVTLPENNFFAYNSPLD